MKNTRKLAFQPPFWKKLRKLQIRPTAIEMAVGLKSLATAVDFCLRSNIDVYKKNCIRTPKFLNGPL